MASSLRASKRGLQIVDQARRNKGWNRDALGWIDVAIEEAKKLDERHINISQATLARFWQPEKFRIHHISFKSICKAVGKDWELIVDLGSETMYKDFFAYDDRIWVGREDLISGLRDRLREACRVLALVGITGIGKTALAERLAVELQDWFERDWEKKLSRANFDCEPTDFASVAARWLEAWGEAVPTEKRLLLNKIVKHLCDNRVLVLLDSLETILTGDEENGWGDFADEYWGFFFQRLLSETSCKGRVIITSQDLPVKLRNNRNQNHWHYQVIYGLNEQEQEALFDVTGLDASQKSSNRPLLLRLGKVYKGHPLVLKVIIGEITNSFGGNVQAYWKDVSNKIEEVEQALAEAARGEILGNQDEWELHNLTMQVQGQVNRERLEIAFNRLKTDVHDAYLLLCAASVYRTPVQKEGWLMQLAGLVSDLENQECSESRQKNALYELSNRFLIEESVNDSGKILGQHNLVRSAALAHHKKLLDGSSN